DGLRLDEDDYLADPLVLVGAEALHERDAVRVVHDEWFQLVRGELEDDFQFRRGADFLLGNAVDADAGLGRLEVGGFEIGGFAVLRGIDHGQELLSGMVVTGTTFSASVHARRAADPAHRRPRWRRNAASGTRRGGCWCVPRGWLAASPRGQAGIMAGPPPPSWR